MAIMAPPLTSDEVASAMIEGLTDRIRSELKKRITERIEPDIDAAVEAALASFKSTIETMTDGYHMQNVVRVLIDRRTPQ
jgi:hypothetical protein